MTQTARSALRFEFETNELAQRVCGAHDENLMRLDYRTGAHCVSRGALVSIDGEEGAQNLALSVLAELQTRASKGQEIGIEDVDSAYRFARDQGSSQAAPIPSLPISGSISQGPAPAARSPAAPGLASQADESDGDLRQSWSLRGKTVVAGNPAQNHYMRMLDQHEMVFGLGPAGTGKTFLAVAKGIQLLFMGEVQRLIISRPAVEAGERLGFLPGDLKDKVDPYLRPIYDALNELMGVRETQKALESGVIEVAPLAFMRGRTLKEAFVILDEAQNTSAMQMKMFLTRLGHRSRMVINGDLGQVDLPPSQTSGLRDARNKLSGIREIGMMQFSSADVMRHDLVAKILNAYESNESSLQDQEGGQDTQRRLRSGSSDAQEQR